MFKRLSKSFALPQRNPQIKVDGALDRSHFQPDRNSYEILTASCGKDSRKWKTQAVCPLFSRRRNSFINGVLSCHVRAVTRLPSTTQGSST